MKTTALKFTKSLNRLASGRWKNAGGTGVYYPGGRQTPWTYQDANGDWHLTHGQRAKPYIKPAVADHAAQYNRIIEQELKGK